MSAFAAALAQFQAVPQNPQQWQAFLTGIGDAYQEDLKKEGGRKKPIILDSQYKPEKYSDDKDTKAQLTFKQWSSDVRSVLKRYNGNYGKMLDLAADRNEWVEDEVIEEMESQEGYFKADLDTAGEEIFEFLKTVTTGDARSIVDAHEDKGLEAWWRLHNRYRPKGLRGSTDIAKRIQSIRKPTNTLNTFTLLQQLENDVRDFAKASVGEPMPTAIIRSAMLSCVTENIENAVKLQLDIDTVPTHTP